MRESRKSRFGLRKFFGGTWGIAAAALSKTLSLPRRGKWSGARLGGNGRMSRRDQLEFDGACPALRRRLTGVPWAH